MKELIIEKIKDALYYVFVIFPIIFLSEVFNAIIVAIKKGGGNGK